MKIEIVKKGWLWKKFHARIIHNNGNVLFWSQNQKNLTDLEEMIENLKKNFTKAIVIYDFKVKEDDQ